VGADDHIIGDHARLLAAEELGMKGNDVERQRLLGGFSSRVMRHIAISSVRSPASGGVTIFGEALAPLQKRSRSCIRPSMV
jgi:hypothetical protein